MESPLGQHVVDQVAVQPTAAALERMDIDEAEGEDRGGNNRVELLRGLFVEGDHAVYELGQIIRPRAEMVRDRHSCLTVAFPDKTAFRPQTEIDEAGIADHDALQAQQFVKIDWLPAGLADCAAPPSTDRT